MNRRIANKRFDGIEQAKALLRQSEKRTLTEEEIETLKKCHSGFGGLSKNGTQFFTPDSVTNFMTDIIGKIEDQASVLEFSCGAGAFIDAVYRNNPNVNVTGIELAYDLSQIAALCYPEAKIIQGDALEYMDRFKNSFDLVIGNPPFGKSGGSYNNFKHSKRRLEEQFIEMAVNCLKEGGEAILIVPDGVCANLSSKSLRKWLMDECYYRASISLPPETFYFSGTSCKTTIIYFKKKYIGHDPADYPILMAECQNIGWNSRGQTTTLPNDLEKIKEAFAPAKANQDIILSDPAAEKAS